MNAWRVARIGIRALTLVVVTVSGIYLLVYLYRWEWNRALISGLFFVAALVTFSTSLVLGSLRSLGERIDRLERATRAADRLDDTDSTRQVIERANDETAAHRFDWLREPPDRFGVFVPVLLGTGLLLSGLAYLVERLAALLAGATLDRRTARLLAPELPLGTAPLDVVPAGRRAPKTSQTRVPRLLGWLVVIAVGSLVTVAAIDVIADATQSRTNVIDAGGTTAIDLAIEQRGFERSAEVVALAIWTACENTLRVQANLVGAESLGADRVRITLDHGLGDLARRRLFGCMEDATLDLVKADVIGFAVTTG